MGFSVRLAPGVRVRASSRGVRTSLGPRVARVHIGGGRTGFSTGVGPVSYYTSASGGRRRTSSGRPGTATANRQLAAAARAAEKQEQAQTLADALLAIHHVHRADFPPARPQVAPAPPPVDVAAFRAKHVKSARSSTSIFARTARKAALKEAEERAQTEATELGNAWERERRMWQAALDEQWVVLNANDSATVLTVLADAFEDNEAAAAAVGVEGSEVTLVVLVPNARTLPDRRPTTTPAGNLSLKKLTKGETADMYKQLVCGHALVTVKEAFAVAPALTSARVVAMRPAAPDAYGTVRPEVVLAARFERARLDGIQWGDADALQIVTDASDELVLIQKGSTKELTPLDLSKEPALAQVAQAVDFEDLRS